MIIDWKRIALKIYDEISKEVKNLKNTPTLWAILVWDNPSSLRYIWQKRKWAEYVWINFELKTLDKDISHEDLLKVIKDFNEDKNISSYIIQLPLPEQINTEEIINSIDPKKDADWFTALNMWKISLWDESVMFPCTPSGIMKIIKEENIDLIWKFVVVIWRSNIVWKPITSMLLNSWATVINCNSKTKNIEDFTKKADIVIVVTWNPGLLKLDMIGKDTMVIDVWFTVIDWKIHWDTCFEDINNAWNKITPVPGWVGPLTVAYLMKNTLKSHKLNNI